MDRSSATSTKKRGGGVLMLTHTSLPAKIVKINFENVEQLYISFEYGNNKYIIGGVYIPPNSPIDLYATHCQTVEEIVSGSERSKFFIFGDYNLPDAIWFNDEFGVSVNSPQGHPAHYIASSFSYLNLFQNNNIPNNNNVYLDLLFSNSNNIVVRPAIDLLLPNSHHHIGYCFNINIKNSDNCLQYTEFYYDFKNAAFYNYGLYLSSFNWEELLKNTVDIDHATELFYEILYRGIAYFVPIKKIHDI